MTEAESRVARVAGWLIAATVIAALMFVMLLHHLRHHPRCTGQASSLIVVIVHGRVVGEPHPHVTSTPRGCR